MTPEQYFSQHSGLMSGGNTPLGAVHPGSMPRQISAQGAPGGPDIVGMLSQMQQDLASVNARLNSQGPGGASVRHVGGALLDGTTMVAAADGATGGSGLPAFQYGAVRSGRGRVEPLPTPPSVAGGGSTSAMVDWA
ncbi:hypothetical protein VaNZ11_008526, partial [Volvox africanus]